MESTSIKPRVPLVQFYFLLWHRNNDTCPPPCRCLRITTKWRIYRKALRRKKFSYLWNVGDQTALTGFSLCHSFRQKNGNLVDSSTWEIYTWNRSFHIFFTTFFFQLLLFMLIVNTHTIFRARWSFILAVEYWHLYKDIPNVLDKDILKAEELLAVFLGSVCASFSIFVIFS